MPNPQKELDQLDAESKALEERENIETKLGLAIHEQRSATEALAYGRSKVEDAENALRFHERCVREAPELINAARFSPQRMLLLADGEFGLRTEEWLLDHSDTIDDLRFFLDNADEISAILRQRITPARKSIPALESAVKDADRELARLQQVADDIAAAADHAIEKQILNT